MHLQAYRKAHGLSQCEFGQELNPPASQGLVSQWECGETRVTLDYALQIAEVTANEVTPTCCAAMFRDRMAKSSP